METQTIQPVASPQLLSGLRDRVDSLHAAHPPQLEQVKEPIVQVAEVEDADVALERALEELEKVAQKLNALESVGRTKEVRMRALKTARDLVRTLDAPEEAVFREAFESHSRSLCVRLAVAMGLFDVLAAADTTPITAVELSKACNADENFLVRIVRLLTCMGYAEETDVRTYLPTPMTKAMTKKSMQACVIHSFDTSSRVQGRAPEYFRQAGYSSPEDVLKGPFQHGMNTDKTFFQFIHDDPARIAAFNEYMKGNRITRRHWTEWFPVQERLLTPWRNAPKTEAPLIVDMGGGSGHDLRRFLATFPEARDRVLLQDLPKTIESVQGTDLVDGIAVMPHDIFEQQPVHGAAVYYTHFLLHDFPNERCRVFLQHLAAAMTPGYSKILLNEMTLPDRDCPSFFAAADITMMCNLSALCRSEREWRDLVESVEGLHLEKLWMSPDSGDCEAVIEIVKR